MRDVGEAKSESPSESESVSRRPTFEMRRRTAGAISTPIPIAISIWNNKNGSHNQALQATFDSAPERDRWHPEMNEKKYLAKAQRTQRDEMRMSGNASSRLCDLGGWAREGRRKLFGG